MRAWPLGRATTITSAASGWRRWTVSISTISARSPAPRAGNPTTKGKPIRETSFADIPLAIDHFRYFAACVRAQEGTLSELDHDTIAYHYHEPLGGGGQI